MRNPNKRRTRPEAGYMRSPWLTQQQVDARLLAFFKTIRIENAETRQWFVDVIKARAQAGRAENKQHRVELLRQHELIEAKLQTLLELRIEGEIG
jgi:hypothetical protein